MAALASLTALASERQQSCWAVEDEQQRRDDGHKASQNT